MRIGASEGDSGLPCRSKSCHHDTGTRRQHRLDRCVCKVQSVERNAMPALESHQALNPPYNKEASRCATPNCAPPITRRSFCETRTSANFCRPQSGTPLDGRLDG